MCTTYTINEAMWLWTHFDATCPLFIKLSTGYNKPAITFWRILWHSYQTFCQYVHYIFNFDCASYGTVHVHKLQTVWTMLYLNFWCQLYNYRTTKRLMSRQQYNQLSSHQHQHHRSVYSCITLLIVFTASIVMVWALAISCQVTMATEIHCAVSHKLCLSYIWYHQWIIFHMNTVSVSLQQLDVY